MEMDDREKKGGSRRYIMQAVEDSLRRLKTDWIDLYQYHRPDPLTPIDETLRALDDLVRQGKVRYIGCSNMPSWQVATAQWTARDLGLNAFASAQDEYSLLVRDAEKELIPAANRIWARPPALFPAGLRSADRQVSPQRRDASRRAPDQDAAPCGPLPHRGELGEDGEARGLLRAARPHHGRARLQLLLARPVVSSVIAGATKPEQILANVEAADWALSDRGDGRDRRHHEGLSASLSEWSVSAFSSRGGRPSRRPRGSGRAGEGWRPERGGGREQGKGRGASECS